MTVPVEVYPGAAGLVLHLAPFGPRPPVLSLLPAAAVAGAVAVRVGHGQEEPVEHAQGSLGSSGLSGNKSLTECSRCNSPSCLPSPDK